MVYPSPYVQGTHDSGQVFGPPFFWILALAERNKETVRGINSAPTRCNKKKSATPTYQPSSKAAAEKESLPLAQNQW